MNRKNGKKSSQAVADAVVSRPPSRNGGKQPQSVGITDIKHWEGPFEDLPFWNIIDKIFDAPDDIVAFIIRSVITDVRLGNAIVLFAARCEKFHDDRHLRMLKMKLATEIARGGRGRIEALFGAIRLLAPGMYRDVMGLSKGRREKEQGEEVMKGYEIKQEREDKE